VPDALVGVDVGTTGVKALAIDTEGSIVARAEHGYPLSTPQPGWSEQDPRDWWEATEAVLAELRARSGAPAGIGLSGQMHGLVALDAGGEVVLPAILWNDQRTAAECKEIEETLGLDRLIALTGNRALPGFTAPKLVWMRRHEPDAGERRTASRLRPAAATRPRGRSGSGRTGPGRCRSCSGPRVSCSRRWSASPPTPTRGYMRSATRFRAPGTRWA
jgi:glycerol kinase